jgi:putative sterol carrier protein
MKVAILSSARRFFCPSNGAMIAACISMLAPALPTTGRSAEPPAPTTAQESEPLTDDSTPADVFETMRRGFNVAASKGVHAHYQFNLSGPAGGAWWIIVNDGEFTMGMGSTENPDVVMTSTDRDWVMLATGSLSGIRAYFTGRLKVTGDQSLARKLEAIFP